MHLSIVAIIVIAELFLVTLAGCGLLWLQNCRLRDLSGRLQGRMNELVVDISESRAREAALGRAPASESYSQKLESQLALTRSYHTSIAEGHDIALDLDLEAPVRRRTAALRYALLIAERDALGDKTDDHPNWDKLEHRYQQLVEYYAAGDESELQADAEPDQLSELQEELESYKKRVANLERFKSLFFELESRWNSSKREADVHYEELSEIGSRLEDSTAFDEALERYQRSYDSIADLVEKDGDSIIANSASARAAQQATGEIRHLRNIAADQHRIIYDLQQKLVEATSKEEAAQFAAHLQEELAKQLRYAQESDTCIQLLEQELAAVHREAEHAQTKIRELGLAKAEVKEIRAAKQAQEQLVLDLKSENQRLKNKMRALKKVPPQQTVDPQLKKQLTVLQSKYAELEAQYLDLKLQG